MPIPSRTNTTDPLYNYMLNVSKKLECSATNDTLIIPEAKGKGFIKSFYIEEGFCIGYYHFTLHEDLHFKWITDDETKEEPIFKLFFRLKTVSIEPLPGAKEIVTNCAENSTVLYSTDFERRGFIPQDKLYDAVGMIFTSTWLNRNFAAASAKIYDIVNLLIKKNKPTFIAEVMEPNHYTIVKQICEEMTKENFAPIHIKTKSLLLVNDFLDRIVKRKTADLSSNQTLYQPEMIKVECRLSQFYDKPFPNLAKLSKEFAMSEATLKRHFKIVFGKSIHQYYLEKKLALGREMIEEKKRSISEIAYMLGYNKINSFSKVFKKYYGILPKEVKGIL